MVMRAVSVWEVQCVGGAMASPGASAGQHARLHGVSVACVSGPHRPGGGHTVMPGGMGVARTVRSGRRAVWRVPRALLCAPQNLSDLKPLKCSCVPVHDYA